MNGSDVERTAKVRTPTFGRKRRYLWPAIWASLLTFIASFPSISSDYRGSLEAGMLLIGAFLQIPGMVPAILLNSVLGESGVHGDEFDAVILPLCWAFYFFLFQRFVPRWRQ